MRNFSTAYKKRFKEMLYPHGYINKKSFFYKLEDDVFFIICAKGKHTGERGAIWTFASPYPYCTDIAPDDFDVRGLVDNMFLILQRIDPIKFTLEYYANLIRITGEDGFHRNLDDVCGVIEEVVLPYIHRFADLEYYYNEIQMLKDSNIANAPIGVTDEDFVYLSIKLRKYENAIIYLDKQMSTFSNNMNYAKAVLTKSESGNIDEWTLIVKKMKPDIVEIEIRAAKEAIVKWGKKISEVQAMKDALLSNDHNYLDSYIKEIETRSRACLQDM